MESYEFVIKPNNRDLFFLSVKKLFTNITVQVIYIFLSFLLGFLFYFIGVEADNLIYLALYIVISYLVIYIFAILSVSIKLYTRNTRKKHVPKVIIYERSMIDKNGYTEYTANGVNMVRWNELYLVKMDKWFYRLYVRVNSQYILIPQRNLSQEANEMMRNIISENELLIKKQNRKQPLIDSAENPTAEQGYPNAVNTQIRAKDAMLYGLYDLYRNHIYLIIVYIIVVLEFLFFAFSGYDLTYAVILAAFVIFLNVIMILSIYIRSRGYNKQPNIVSFFLNNTEFYCKTKFGETKIQWAKLYRVVSTKNYFYFYISKKLAFIAPKRDIAPENITALGVLFYNYRLYKAPSRR